MLLITSVMYLTNQRAQQVCRNTATQQPNVGKHEGREHAKGQEEDDNGWYRVRGDVHTRDRDFKYSRDEKPSSNLTNRG